MGILPWFSHIDHLAKIGVTPMTIWLNPCNNHHQLYMSHILTIYIHHISTNGYIARTRRPHSCGLIRGKKPRGWFAWRMAIPPVITVLVVRKNQLPVSGKKCLIASLKNHIRIIINWIITINYSQTHHMFDHHENHIHIRLITKNNKHYI